MGDGRDTMTFVFGLAVLYLAGIFLIDSGRRESFIVDASFETSKATTKIDAEAQVSHASDTPPSNPMAAERMRTSSTSATASTCTPTARANLCAVSALCRAIVQRDLSSIEKQISAIPQLASTQHSLGYYPLIVALLSGELKIVELILAQPGVSPNCNTYPYDVSTADDAVLRSEFSANPSYKLILRATAMHYACMTNNPQMIEIICRVSDSYLTLDRDDKVPVDYIDSSSDEGLKALRVYTAAREQWENRYDTFGPITREKLARAIFHRDTTLFENLLRCLKALNFYRRPPVSPDAYEREMLHDLETLQSHPYRHTWTYLHVAVMNQYLPFIESIVEADPLVVNAHGSGFHECKPFVHTHSIPYELMNGATPLHIASLLGNFEVIAILLKAGALWEIVDDVGRTAHDYVLFAHGEDQAKVVKKMFEEEGCRRRTLGDEESAATGCDTENTLRLTSSERGFGDNGDNSSDNETEDENDVEGKGLDIEQIIGAKIIGQRGPVRSVASAIRLRKNGWVDPDRPLVMLFLGSSGVGKTELAKQIAMYIHGEDGSDLTAGEAVTELENDSKFVRIDMSEYQQEHTVANLIGSPKGYVGYEDGGFLTSRLRENPGAIVLLDEIEKAHPDVLTLFLQVFDDGRVTDSRTGVVHCKNAVFIMTSNLASDEIKWRSSELREVVERTEDRHEEYTRVIDDFNREIHPILKYALKRDEFLGRINQIVVFLPLSKEEISTVVNNELKTWKARAKKTHGIELDWSVEVVEKLTEGFDVNYGVRSVINQVRRTAVQSVAEAQIRGVLRKNYLAYLTIDALGDIKLNSERRTGHIRNGNRCRYALDCM